MTGPKKYDDETRDIKHAIAKKFAQLVKDNSPDMESLLVLAATEGVRTYLGGASFTHMNSVKYNDDEIVIRIKRKASD